MIVYVYDVAHYGPMDDQKTLCGLDLDDSHDQQEEGLQYFFSSPLYMHNQEMVQKCTDCLKEVDKRLAAVVEIEEQIEDLQETIRELEEDQEAAY